MRTWIDQVAQGPGETLVWGWATDPEAARALDWPAEPAVLVLDTGRPGLGPWRLVLRPDLELELARAAVTLASQGWTVTPPLALPPGEALSERETEVLQLSAQGEPVKAMAWKLGLSESTVKFHLAQVYRKLGAQNRTEALALALERGWLVL